MRLTRRKRNLSGSSRYQSVALTALLTPLAASLAHGQAALDETKLDEIIVTAQRREESLDKVAVSVTAFSQKTMDEYHITTFEDLASVDNGHLRIARQHIK